MSTHDQHDEDVQIVGGYEGENSLRRHRPHAHLHLNPTIVIDHIKTRVKRRRPLNNSLTEPSTSPTNNDENTKRTVQPIISSSVSSDQHSDTNDGMRNNDIIHVHSLDDEDDADELTPKPLDFDNEIIPGTTKPKFKEPKQSKTLTEMIHTKNRGQTIRRKGFEIRDEDFNKIFSNLSSDEQIIVSYPCAWQKDVFMDGRLFLSANHLCFYTCFFKYEESLCLAYKDIACVTREKSTKDCPTATKVKTKNGEQYLFGSYVSNVRIFLMVFRLWKNALLEKPLDSSQFRVAGHADPISGDDSTAESEDSTRLANTQRTDQVVSSHSFQDPEKPMYVSTCSCEAHLARTYVDRVFSYPVDTLFDLIFGNNSFTRAFQESQRLLDYTPGEWCTNPETGRRERIVTYRTVTQSILGTNTITCHERQIIEMRKSHSMYVVSTEVNNEGMKYTDAFLVATKFCMYQQNPKHSALRISAEIKYIKNVNAIARAFIDKNANASLEEGVHNQVRNLENHQAALSNPQSTKNQTLISKQHLRTKKESDGHSRERKAKPAFHAIQNQTSIIEKISPDKQTVYNILLFLGVFLLLLHVYLCYKLYAIDQFLYTSKDICSSQCQKVCNIKKHDQ